MRRYWSYSRKVACLDGWVILFAVGAGGTLAWLSVARYLSYNTGMLDLGNMAQAIWSATQGEPLVFTVDSGNLSRLAFHVEIAYLLLAPLYALWPSPMFLLILQAGLYAAGSFPVYSLGQRHLGHRWSARCIVLCYLLYPVAQTSVLFDLHGDTLAMPLLLFALEALDRDASGWYSVWLVLSLSCKAYVGVPVSVLGVTLWLSGRRRTGAFTAILGALWLIVAMIVVRPLFAGIDGGPAEATASGYLQVYFGELASLLVEPGALVPRLLTGFIVFLPSLWLTRKAMVWLLPALSVGLPALAAGGAVTAYDYRFHHYALVVPFVVFASIRGAEVLRARKPGTWVLDVLMQTSIVGLCSLLLVDTPLSPYYWASPPGWGRDVWAYGITARDGVKDAWLADSVPDGEPAMASFFLAAHLTNRSLLFLPQPRQEWQKRDVHVLIEERLRGVEHVVLDALFDYTPPSTIPRLDPFAGRVSLWPTTGPGHPQPVPGGVFFDRAAIAAMLRNPDFVLLDARDGLLYFGRRSVASDGIALFQTARLVPKSVLRVQVRFSDSLGLVSADCVPLSGRRYRLEYEWVALRALGPDSPYFAVSRIGGVDDARFVHLPSLALYPVASWSPARVVHERFDIEVPRDVSPGTYQLSVAWYDGSQPYAGLTDTRSRLGDEVTVCDLWVE